MRFQSTRSQRPRLPNHPIVHSNTIFQSTRSQRPRHRSNIYQWPYIYHFNPRGRKDLDVSHTVIFHAQNKFQSTRSQRPRRNDITDKLQDSKISIHEVAKTSTYVWLGVLPVKRFQSTRSQRPRPEEEVIKFINYRFQSTRSQRPRPQGWIHLHGR